MVAIWSPKWNSHCLFYPIREDKNLKNNLKIFQLFYSIPLKARKILKVRPYFEGVILRATRPLMLKRSVKVHVFSAGSREILLMQWLMRERQSNKQNHSGSPWKTAHFLSSFVHWWAVFQWDDRSGHSKYHGLKHMLWSYLKKFFIEHGGYFICETLLPSLIRPCGKLPARPGVLPVHFLGIPHPRRHRPTFF